MYGMMNAWKNKRERNRLQQQTTEHIGACP
jgi:hypothetical protein